MGEKQPALSASQNSFDIIPFILSHAATHGAAGLVQLAGGSGVPCCVQVSKGLTKAAIKCGPWMRGGGEGTDPGVVVEEGPKEIADGWVGCARLPV